MFGSHYAKIISEGELDRLFVKKLSSLMIIEPKQAPEPKAKGDYVKELRKNILRDKYGR